MSKVKDDDVEPENLDQNTETMDGDEEKKPNTNKNEESITRSDLDSEISIDESDHLDNETDDNVSELAEELAETKDQLLRAVAETENVRRRAQREKEDAGKYAITNFAREILIVSDNIVRALDSERLEEEKQAKSELSAVALLERFNSFILGVTMIETEMKKTFDRIGIEKIDPVGQAFDPKYHHALFEVEDLDKPAGTVVQVVEAGYLLRDRLLREAKVGVSKGGPKMVDDETKPVGDFSEAEDVANAYESSVETGNKVDKEL